MISPFKGRFKVTSPRGYRELFGQIEYHKGIDLVGIDTDIVCAVADGRIEAIPYEADGFGYYIRQRLPDGKRIYYAHMRMDSAFVKQGDNVIKGQPLGVMGFTGYVTGTHTHLEYRDEGYSGTSLDITELTGIPNKQGIYTMPYYYSNNKQVENIMLDKISTQANVENWELMLSGKAPVKLNYFTELLDRYHEALASAKENKK